MKSKQEPLVSVVTPVYNGEPYLSQCIEAVLAQTYAHWQYIIVDNCSTDRSLEIAKKYARAESRIKVVEADQHRDQVSNFDYSATFVPCEAKYCKFAFADDLLLPSCLEEMVKVAECDPEISIISCFITSGKFVRSMGIPFGTNIISGREACRLYLLNGISPFGSLNSLMVRADEIRRRKRFHNYNDFFFEDADVCFDILKNSKLGFVHQILTFNRRDNEATLAKIEGFNPFLLTELLFLYRYGNYYLDREELERRWNEKSKEYLKFLAKSVLARREEAFWAFHKRGMEEMRVSFSKSLMAREVLMILLDHVFNPKASIERLVARLINNSRGHNHSQASAMNKIRDA